MASDFQHGGVKPVELLDHVVVGAWLGFGRAHGRFGCTFRRLIDCVHRVVVGHRDDGIRARTAWVLKELVLIPYKWLRTDFVRPSPFLGCEQSRALDGSGTLLVLLIGMSEWTFLCRGKRGEVFVDTFGLIW